MRNETRDVRDGYYAAKRRGTRELRAEDLKATILDVMCNLANNLSYTSMQGCSRDWVTVRHEYYDAAHLYEICEEIQEYAISGFDSLSRAETRRYSDLWVEQVDGKGRRLAETCSLLNFDNLNSADKDASRLARIGAKFLHGSYNFSVGWVEAQKRWRITFRTDIGPAESWLLTLARNSDRPDMLE